MHVLALKNASLLIRNHYLTAALQPHSKYSDSWRTMPRHHKGHFFFCCHWSFQKHHSEIHQDSLHKRAWQISSNANMFGNRNTAIHLSGSDTLNKARFKDHSYDLAHQSILEEFAGNWVWISPVASTVHSPEYIKSSIGDSRGSNDLREKSSKNKQFRNKQKLFLLCDFRN